MLTVCPGNTRNLLVYVRTHQKKQQQYDGYPVESIQSVSVRTPYTVFVQYATTVEYLETNSNAFVVYLGFSFVLPFSYLEVPDVSVLLRMVGSLFSATAIIPCAERRV